MGWDDDPSWFFSVRLRFDHAQHRLHALWDVHQESRVMIMGRGGRTGYGVKLPRFGGRLELSGATEALYLKALDSEVAVNGVSIAHGHMWTMLRSGFVVATEGWTMRLEGERHGRAHRVSHEPEGVRLVREWLE